jgi:hypothetical protein
MAVRRLPVKVGRRGNINNRYYNKDYLESESAVPPMVSLAGGFHNVHHLRLK